MVLHYPILEPVSAFYFPNMKAMKNTKNYSKAVRVFAARNEGKIVYQGDVRHEKHEIVEIC